MRTCSYCKQPFQPQRPNQRFCWYGPCHELRLGRRKRGNTTQRNYGAAHQKLRRDFKKVVQAGKAYCWRCGGWIPPDTPGQPTGWHVGHDDHDRSIVRGPEHARECNLRAAAVKVNKARAGFTSSTPRIAR